VTETCTIDGRQLPAPEPLERVFEALAGLRADQRLRLLIHREPLPLYELLRGGGFRWESRALADGCFEVLIWQDA
jgi:uncharacterized protein (DUF2249 family)